MFEVFLSGIGSALLLSLPFLVAKAVAERLWPAYALAPAVVRLVEKLPYLPCVGLLVVVLNWARWLASAEAPWFEKAGWGVIVCLFELVLVAVVVLGLDKRVVGSREVCVSAASPDGRRTAVAFVTTRRKSIFADTILGELLGLHRTREATSVDVYVREGWAPLMKRVLQRKEPVTGLLAHLRWTDDSERISVDLTR